LEIISRKLALLQGLTKYFTGKPCKHGHVAERCSQWKECLECREIKNINRRKQYPVEVNGKPVITRCQAKQLGLERYFTGKCCKNGHICERWTIWRSCVECSILKKKKYRENPFTKIKQKEYRERNKEKRSIQQRNYRKRNRSRINAICERYRKRKIQEDPSYKIAINLRARMRHALLGKVKSGSAVRDLGCSVEFFKEYLEKQFKEGMSWDNHGDWHFDHKIPLAEFNLSDRNEFLKACHYTNIQPLWAHENLAKGAKLQEELENF